MLEKHRMPPIARFIYNHNPFYVISAVMVLFGVLRALGGDAENPQTAWVLAGTLGAYTLLLAVTAVLIIKLGRVWEDARSIVLINILLFVALSTSFDNLCNVFPSTARYVLTLGFVFSVCVSEFVIRGLRLHLPVLYRGPYYLILAMFFAIPLWVSPGMTDQPIHIVRWRIFLFPTLCGLAFLSLIPGIRQSSRAVAKNTPWRWPWYPWLAFAFLGFGVAVRSYVLTLSFYPEFDLRSDFAGYYLVPLFFAFLVLLLEISIVEKIVRLQRGILLGAPLLLLLSFTGGNEEMRRPFAAMLNEQLGVPLWWVTLLLVAFYAFAWSRRLRFAEWALAGTLATIALIDRYPTVLDRNPVLGNGTVDVWPLILAAVVQSWACWYARNSYRIFAMGTLWVLCGVVLLWESLPSDRLFVLAVHGGLAVSLTVGCLFDDPFARMLRAVSACTLACSGLSLPVAWGLYGVPSNSCWNYAGGTMVVALVVWSQRGEGRWLLAIASQALGSGWIAAVMFLREMLRTWGPEVIVAVSLGLTSFVVGVWISAVKGGMFNKLDWSALVSSKKMEQATPRIGSS